MASLVVGAWAEFGRGARPGAAASAAAPTPAEIEAEIRNVHVVIYFATWCPSCSDIKTFLWEHSVPYEEHDVDKEREAHDRLVALNPERTIPLIDVEGTLIKGADRTGVAKALTAAAERHLRASPDASDASAP
jgi:glutaredoxin